MKKLKFYYYNVFGDGNRTDEESCEAWIPDQFWERLACYYKVNPDGDALQEPEFKDVWEMCRSAAVEKNLKNYEWDDTLYYYSFFYWPKGHQASDNTKKRDLDYLQNGLKYVIRDDFPKEDLCGMQKIEDEIYDLIRSEEIREHAKKHWNLSPEDMVLLIHLSFYPIEKRYEFLKMYADTLENGDAKRYAEDFVKAYRMVIDHIYHPKERVLYLCELARPSVMEYRTKEEEVRSALNVRDFELQDWYDSLEELVETEVTSCEPMEPGYLFSVYEVSIPSSGKSDDKVHFYMESIDGRNEISKFDVSDDWLRESGISEAVINDLFNGGIGGRHSYPFANFGSVLLQTPLMEKPLKCTIISDLDGNYCWYQWLYPRLPKIPEYPGWEDLYGLDEGWYMDMSYWMANLTGHYSTFDWIRSDPESNDCFPEDLARINRSWENIQYMIPCRSGSKDNNQLISQVSHSLWPLRLALLQRDGRPQKVLLLQRGSSNIHTEKIMVEDSEFNRIAMEHTDLFEESIKKICGIECKVVYWV